MTDLDDGGEAPVSEDAAHYFTVLRLRYGKELTRKVISGYVAAVADPARAVAIDPRQVPDWKAERRRDLDRYTRGDRFRQSKALRRAGQGTRERIRTAASGDPRLRRLDILDVATVTRVQGGSGGLTRYWLLVQDGGTRRILELKQIGRAGTDELRLEGRTLDPAARVRSLQKWFWGFEGKRDWYVTSVGGTPFLVRDRSSIEKVELDKLKPRQLERVLLAQAGYLAGVHRPAWSGVRPEAMEEYLAGRTRDLAKAYQLARKRMR
jgi:hypothetical protein